MKTTVFLILISGGWAIPAWADDNTSLPDFGSMFIDPDAVAKVMKTSVIPSFGPPPPEAPAPPDLETRKKAFDDREWLLRDYALQVRERAKNGSAADQTELAAVLVEKDDLARAAGFSPAEVEKMAAEDQLQAPDNTATDKPKAPADTEAAPAPIRPPNSFLKPFLASDKPVAPLPFSAASPVFAPLTVPFSPDTDSFSGLSSSQNSSSNVDSASMDVPGMTAAKNNPSSLEALDLSEPLPGETKARSSPSFELDLPIARNSDRIKAMQDEALAIPGQITQKAPVAPPQPLQLAIPETATQQMVRDPSPIRNRVADPYDILR